MVPAGGLAACASPREVSASSSPICGRCLRRRPGRCGLRAAEGLGGQRQTSVAPALPTAFSYGFPDSPTNCCQSHAERGNCFKTTRFKRLLAAPQNWHLRAITRGGEQQKCWFCLAVGWSFAYLIWTGYGGCKGRTRPHTALHGGGPLCPQCNLKDWDQKNI